MVRRWAGVPGASLVTVGIATAPATATSPPAGSPVEVIDGRHHVTLSAALLAQPRLVTDGDARGGRHVSGVVDIYVGTGPAR